MAGVGLTPSLAMAAEDIRDLQGETSHEKRASGGRFRLGGALRRDLGQVQIEPLQRAGDVADRVDGDARIKRGRFQLGVSERTRVMMLLSLRH
jgi:hypothetical protein